MEVMDAQYFEDICKDLPVAGTFFALEGGEGSGKSTLLKSLSTSLKQLYGEDNVVITRDPGGTPLGEKIRPLCTQWENGEEPTQTAEFFLFSAARAELMQKVIEPALADGKIVLTDRWIESTVIYQGHMGAVGADFIKRVFRYSRIQRPVKTIILDVRAETGLSRANQGGFETNSMAYHAVVNSSYAQLADVNPTMYAKIATTGVDVASIHSDALGIISSVLKDYVPQEQPGDDLRKMGVTVKKLAAAQDAQ